MKIKFLLMVALLLTLFQPMWVEVVQAEGQSYVDLNNTVISEDWAKELMNINDAHKSGITGNGIKIAVMDTGVFDSDEYTVVGGLDCVRAIFKQCPERNVSTYPSNMNEHGTQISHIIGNEQFGIAKDALLYDIRVVDIIDGVVDIKDNSIIKGIDYAIENEIDIISMSIDLGIEPSNELLQAFQKANEKGVRIFASAGNLNKIMKIESSPRSNTLNESPCKITYVYCVGGIMKHGEVIERAEIETTRQNQREVYASATGQEIDFVGADGRVKAKNKDGIEVFEPGTSFSTPYVAAVYALYLDYYDNMSKTQIDNIFKGNASKNDLEIGYNENGAGYDWEYGLGYPTFLTRIKGNFDMTFYTEPIEEDRYKQPLFAADRNAYYEIIDVTKKWFKLNTKSIYGNLWIKKADVGEYFSSGVFNIPIDENTIFYEHPFDDKKHVELTVPKGIYSSYHGFDLSNEKKTNTTQPNFKWYKLNYEGKAFWVKEKPAQYLQNIQYMHYLAQDIVYDYPSFDSASQEFGKTKSYYGGGAVYSYYGYDYNDDENRFNWYSLVTDKGLKWYPSKYHLYKAERLPESNGFDDRIVSSWNDYITSDLIQNSKKGTYAAQFEEMKLFTENNFLDIYNRNKKYLYRYVVHEKNSSNGSDKFYLAFSNSPMIFDVKSGMWGSYKTTDGTNFVWVDPTKNSYSSKPYSESSERSISTSTQAKYLTIDVYELNLD